MSRGPVADISVIPLEQLREMLRQAQEAEKLAEYDDCHASYIQRADAARAEQLRLQAEINRREAHYEAIHGK